MSDVHSKCYEQLISRDLTIAELREKIRQITMENHKLQIRLDTFEDCGEVNESDDKNSYYTIYMLNEPNYGWTYLAAWEQFETKKETLSSLRMKFPNIKRFYQMMHSSQTRLYQDRMQLFAEQNIIQINENNEFNLVNNYPESKFFNKLLSLA